MGRDEAEAMALRALAWLLADAEAAGAFLAGTGTGPETLRARLGDPAFLAGVLDHLLEDEARVIAFARTEGIDPAAPARARAALPGGRSVHWT